MPYVVRTSRLRHIRRASTSHLIIATETPVAYVRVDKRWIDACRLAKDSNPRPHSVINTRSDLAGWPRTTWYHIESLCPLPCIYIPIVLWSRPSVDPLTILLIKLLKSYSLVLSWSLGANVALEKCHQRSIVNTSDDDVDKCHRIRQAFVGMELSFSCNVERSLNRADVL
eukprot:COSAG01_NODE_4846_length_4690_cov_307.130530_4_plen_170_part_00